jgi:mono/diheme cytochrome c family protein
MLSRQHFTLVTVVISGFTMGAHAIEPGESRRNYQIVDGRFDARTYNGFRRYPAGCNHCHGPDGMGSTFGPSLGAGLPDIETFRRIVRNGTSNGASVMKGFAGDPNVAPYEDEIYAYLQARAEGRLGRGRPVQAKP